MVRAGWWQPCRSSRPRGTTHVTSFAECGLSQQPAAGGSCDSVDAWLSEQEVWREDEVSTTSYGDDSDSETGSFHSGGDAACHASGERAPQPPFSSVYASASAGEAAAAAAAAAAREDELEIAEWYEDERARDHAASSWRRPLTCAPSPLPRRRHKAPRNRLTLTCGVRIGWQVLAMYSLAAKRLQIRLLPRLLTPTPELSHSRAIAREDLFTCIQRWLPLGPYGDSGRLGGAAL